MVASILAVGSAHAEEASLKRDDSGGQHNFGIGAQLGFYQPNGLALRVGAREFAIEAAGGYMLAALAYTWQREVAFGTEREVAFGTEEERHFEFVFPMQGDIDLTLRVYAGKRELDGGLRLGFRYNELMGLGFGGGAYATKRISRVVQLHCTFGVGIYPNADDRLRGDKVPENADFGFLPPSINWGLNGGIFLFP